MMSFKKNLLTVILAIALVLMGSWLVGIQRSVLIDGMTLVIATMVMTLMIEDFWRKALSARDLLTWEYFGGTLIVSGSVMLWLWASLSATTEEMFVRLGATFLSACLGGWWMAVPYRISVESEDERDGKRVDRFERKAQKKWASWSKKIIKADADRRCAYLADHLAYHLVDDTLAGGLDFSRPLVVIGEKVLTYNEAKDAGADEDTVLTPVRNYICKIADTNTEGK